MRKVFSVFFGSLFFANFAFATPGKTLNCTSSSSTTKLELDLYFTGHPMGGLTAFEGMLIIKRAQGPVERFPVKPTVYYSDVSWDGVCRLSGSEYRLHFDNWDEFDSATKTAKAVLHRGLFESEKFTCH